MGEKALSELDLLILRSIGDVRDVESLSKSVKVPPATLGMRIAKLQLEGYLGDDGTLTVKGKDAIVNE